VVSGLQATPRRLKAWEGIMSGWLSFGRNLSQPKAASILASNQLIRILAEEV
jgi:hypothetical protein